MRARARGLTAGARVLTAGAAAAGAWLLLWGLNGALERRVAGRLMHVAMPAGAGPADVRHAADLPGARLIAPAAPIAAEALVFRSTPAAVASAVAVVRRADAHPRTLATYRSLRAYPGAPPRVPHGLTIEEFRQSSCNNCHERGGYAPRFGAYVPVTPHPERAGCLQCHATDATVVGRPLPDDRPDALCRQCHAALAAAPAERGPAWPAAAWPEVRGSADGAPPDIPHDVQQRGNCLACHMGPAAVAEIRTTHPDRTNCRQCHLAPAEGWWPTLSPPSSTGLP
ncbi:MAG TPA: cytochrome c3 family protein [Longimicrobiales bacterium]|nr:cytochrome c3 family protein [Longimicrobiales bacterium]